MYKDISNNLHADNLELEVDSGPKTTLISRNVTVMGKRTSIRLEPEMWTSLREIAMRERCTTHDICTLVSLRKKPKTSLTAAIRVFLMLYFRAAGTEEGHARAGHGSFEFMKKRAQISNQYASMFSNKKKHDVVYRNRSVSSVQYESRSSEKIERPKNARL